MDPENNVILLRNSKDVRKEDRSQDIRSITEDGAYYCVQFEDEKTYRYNRKNVEWLKNAKILDGTNVDFYHNGRLLNHYVKVLCFDDRYYKFAFENGTFKTYAKSDLEMREDVSRLPETAAFLRYIKDIAKRVSDARESAFLSAQLEKIKVYKESGLYRYIQRVFPKKIPLRDTLIYPFGCNASQKAAVRAAFEQDMSIIEGPPGTGKTQTILNIIANAILRNQSVAVVANANAAVENIREKLKKSGFEFIAALLGNDENLTEFFSGNHALPADLPYRKLSREECARAAREIEDAEKKLAELRRKTVRSAVVREQKERLEKERAVWLAEHAMTGDTPKAARLHFTSRRLLALKAEIECLSENKKKGFFTRLRFLLRYGIFSPRGLWERGDITDSLDVGYYDAKLRELRKEIRRLDAFSARHNITALEDRVKECSLRLFRHALAVRMGQLGAFDFTRESYRNRFSAFLNRFPVVLDTTHALLAGTPAQYLYDYVIVDEAGQVNLTTASIALSKAKNVVLAGDSKQLPPVVQARDVEPLQALTAEREIPSAYDYVTKSLLTSMRAVYGDRIPLILLNEHWRCDPDIIRFCNVRFYEGQLVIRTEHKKGNGVTVRTVPPHCELERRNGRQAAAIEEVLPLYGDREIGIIAPFNNQVNCLKARLKDRDCKVETVHRFQGQEKDVIILSTVVDRVRVYDDERYDFVDRPDLLNVAISRAINRLELVISEQLARQNGSLISDFARYVKYFNVSGEIIPSRVYSVFDLMYKEYAEVLTPLKKRMRRVSVYESENITDALLRSALDKFVTLDFVMHYPLRNIINADFLENEDDTLFVRNEHTHCDFVLFSKMDKAILMVIEVDGKQHAQPIQKNRDQRKDRLLRNAGIPVVRYATTAVVGLDTLEKDIEKIFSGKGPAA